MKDGSSVTIAAVADVHYGVDFSHQYRSMREHIAERADLFLIAGDLTKSGDPAEARALADDLREFPVPVVGVLGNHDYHRDEEEVVVKTLEDAGITVLEGNSVVLDVRGTKVGIAGTKGFGGGFAGASGTAFGEQEMKAFVAHTRLLSERLESALSELETDVRIALLHYSPVRDTLEGEKLEIYPFLGSYLMAEAIDSAGADLVLHGHAHAGSEKGVTPGGISVRNVAQPVIKHAYALYCVGADCEPTEG